MITGLYETHLEVSDLEKAIVFYRDTLGLELAHVEEKRRIAFCWIGQPKQYMLGLWEKPAGELQPRHFAFRCDRSFIIQEAVGWLQQRNLKPYNFLKDGEARPMVFAWMPALAIYFNDPDNNVLELIAVLDGPGSPEWGVISYEEWEKKSQANIP